MASKVHPPRLYLTTYVALLVLLALTVGASFIDFGREYNNAIAIGIACVKALLIILLFMHVRFEPWVTWCFATAGFLWLGILMTLTISEYVTRNNPPGMCPKGEPVFLSNEGPRDAIPYERRTNLGRKQ